MKAEIKRLLSDETTDWAAWEPIDPLNVIHWFSLDIGPVGERGADVFQVAVATRRAVAERRDKARPFKGLILDPFEKEKVEPMLREFVGSLSGTWDEIVAQLRAVMLWEYE